MKGELAVKLFGRDLKTLEAKADEMQGVMGQDSRRGRPGHVSGARPAQRESECRSRRRRPLRHQRQRHSGRGRNRGRRKGGQPDSHRRAALRSDRPLSTAVPPDRRGHREHPHPRAFRRTRLARPALYRSLSTMAHPRSIAKATPATSPSSTACAAAIWAAPCGRRSTKSDKKSNCPRDTTSTGPANTRASSARIAGSRSSSRSRCC